MAVASILGACHAECTLPIEKQTAFVFYGAGEANLGIANLLVAELTNKVCGNTCSGQDVPSLSSHSSRELQSVQGAGLPDNLSTIELDHSAQQSCSSFV